MRVHALMRHDLCRARLRRCRLIRAKGTIASRGRSLRVGSGGLYHGSARVCRFRSRFGFCIYRCWIIIYSDLFYLIYSILSHHHALAPRPKSRKMRYSTKKQCLKFHTKRNRRKKAPFPADAQPTFNQQQQRPTSALGAFFTHASRNRVVSYGFVFVVAIIVYSNVIDADFVYDDK